jgi:hypothetical protein
VGLAGIKLLQRARGRPAPLARQRHRLPCQLHLNLSRDSLTGPGYDDLDLSLAKTTQVNERVRAQFRAEFFNILNHTNLGTPAETVFSGGPTQGTAANQTTVAALSPTAGVVTSAATTRQIQLGLKFLF